MIIPFCASFWRNGVMLSLILTGNGIAQSLLSMGGVVRRAGS